MKDVYIIHMYNMYKLCNEQQLYKRWSQRVAQITAAIVVV